MIGPSMLAKLSFWPDYMPMSVPQAIRKSFLISSGRKMRGREAQTSTTPQKSLLVKKRPWLLRGHTSFAIRLRVTPIPPILTTRTSTRNCGGLLSKPGRMSTLCPMVASAVPPATATSSESPSSPSSGHFDGVLDDLEQRSESDPPIAAAGEHALSPSPDCDNGGAAAQS